MGASTKRGRAKNNTRLGLIGTAVLLAVLVLVLIGNSAITAIVGQTYQARFAEAGGLAPDDNVVVSGVPVGKVTGVTLSGASVEVSFTINESDVWVGDRARAAIKAQTALGKRALQVESFGTQPLETGAEIPLERTKAPYDVTEALSDLTQTVGEVDTGQLAHSFNTLSDTFRDAPPHLRAALNGVGRLSQTISSRDTELNQLLGKTRVVTGLLNDRKGDVQRIVVDGRALLTELNNRRVDIERLFDGISAVSEQVRGLVAENQSQVGPAFDQLQTVLDLLNKNKENIQNVLTNGVAALRSLGESVSSFPGFDIGLPNLPPTNVVPTLPQLLTGGKQ